MPCVAELLVKERDGIGWLSSEPMLRRADLYKTDLPRPRYDEEVALAQLHTCIWDARDVNRTSYLHFRVPKIPRFLTNRQDFEVLQCNSAFLERL